MKYNINTAVFGNTFALPSTAVDKFLKIATHNQLKVLLYFMRNISEGIDPQKISDALSLPVPEVHDALSFWVQCNVLLGQQEKQQPKKEVVLTTDLPSRSDVTRRGLEDKRIMFMMQEAQIKFGRALKQNESALLVSLYDDHGIDMSVILLLLQYAANCGKCNISFIRQTATEWLKQGVETVPDAERLIAKRAKQSLSWQVVMSAFGIEKRNPSDRELELSDLWINEWKISAELLRAAYNECVDQKSKFSMPYTAKIIENWHKEGVSTPQDVAAQKQQKARAAGDKNGYAGYDLDLFEKMLDKDD